MVNKNNKLNRLGNPKKHHKQTTTCATTHIPAIQPSQIFNRNNTILHQTQISILKLVTNRRDPTLSLPTMHSIRTNNINLRIKKLLKFLSSQHTPPIIRKGIINNVSKYYNNITQNDYQLMNTDSEHEDKTM